MFLLVVWNPKSGHPPKGHVWLGQVGRPDTIPLYSESPSEKSVVLFT